MGDGESGETVRGDLLTHGIGWEGVKTMKNQVFYDPGEMGASGADFDACRVIKIRESPSDG